MSSLRPLYDHQRDALDRLRASLMAGKTRPMLQAPTGFGKTVVAAHIVSGIHRHGKRVCFCVPALGLIDQTFDRFVENGIDPADMGVIQGDHHWRRPQAPIQIATAQTLARREFPEVDYVVVDEAHIRHEVIATWMAEKPEVRFIGMSATPWSKGLGKQFDDLIKPVSTSWLIDNGYLSKFRVFAPSKPDLDGVRTVKGDWHEGDLEERMNQPALVADIVQTWLARGERRPTLCFAVNRRHAKALHDQFADCGVPSEYVDANTPREEREAIGKRLAAGDVQVVVNIGTLTTGIDWDVRCLILARPTKSESLFVQIIGRALRTAPGKDCIARGSLVLTDQGLVEIQNVTLDHKVWDGVSFVSHKGAICNGVRKVITHDGVTATPDHRVMTDGGWQRIEKAARDGRRIARTGFGGTPLRFTGDRVPQGAGQLLWSFGRGLMRSLCSGSHDQISQYAEAAGDNGVPDMQWASTSDGAALALPAMPGPTVSLLFSQEQSIRALWWTWDRVSFLRSKCCGALDRGQSWHQGQVSADRQDRQQWALRTRQSAMVYASREHEQHEEVSRIPTRQVHQFSKETLANSLCGHNTESNDQLGHDGQADYCAVGDAVCETEREVWDILDAGPLQRFTVNGRLVHNCATILDHSDTHMRLGLVTDIDFDALDTGRKDKASERKAKEKSTLLPKCCPSCTALMPVMSKSCVACGYVMPILPGIREVDGDLVEMGRDGKPTGRVIDMLAKLPRRSVYAQLNHIRWQTGKKAGWVAHKYREIYGNWPSNSFGSLDTEDPTPEVRAWVRSQNIRYGKWRQAHNGGGAGHAV